MIEPQLLPYIPYTPTCGYKFHALAVYLHLTFTAPLIGGTFRIKLNICGGELFGEIVNVLGPLVIFTEGLRIFDRIIDRILNATLGLH